MPISEDDLLRDLLNTFQAEAAEHLQSINQSILQLERAPEEARRKTLLQDAFRAAHSLKGAARAVNLPHIERLAHAVENLLQNARDNDVNVSADACDIIYDTLDAIERLLSGESVDADPLYEQLVHLAPLVSTPSIPQVAPAAAEPEYHAEPIIPGDETIRVSVNKLDDLMAQVGELLVAKISAEQRITDLQDIRYKFDHWPRTLREIKLLLPQLKGDAGERLDELLTEYSEHQQNLYRSFNSLNQSFARDTSRLDMVATSLQDKVRHVRMVPFQTLSLALERATRDAARSENKQIAFAIQGGEVELDKRVLEMLKDPLLHVLRNAVTHGIEAPEARAAAGKASEGQITLTVRQRGNEVQITASDDGCGFDINALRQAANGSGHDDMSDDELIDIAFLPGVTTAREVTALSGRGVGLDVVRQSLESIRGRVQVTNRPGQGVTIDLTVPMSLAITRGLLVRAGHECYVLPLLSIEKIIQPEEVLQIGGKSMLAVDDRHVPIVSLRAALERPGAKDEMVGDLLVVVLAVAEQRLALLVDDVLTELELAVKPLGNPLNRVRNVIGAALMGNGEPVIIINPADLMKARYGRYEMPVAVAEDEVQRTRVLVVDDSITTRTLEKNILEMAGYHVTTAIDGVEALDRLENEIFDLIISDIEMPNMNGFELTEKVRTSDAFGHLPLILVTSLESETDREHGMRAGADAYIVKRGFDQAELLTIIQQLV